MGPSRTPQRKAVLLCVVDALASRTVRPALAEGRLPTLDRLVQAGEVGWESVSVFPSVTPAATAALCTGAYPATHGIMGAHFFDRNADRVHYFGADLWVMANKKLRNYFDDFTVQLNDRCLRAPTLFETLEDRGLACASLNFLIYRGPHRHTGHQPWPLRLIPGLRRTVEFTGPSTLCLGDFVGASRVGRDRTTLDARGGLRRRFGFCDETTGDYLAQLAARGLPDFTLAYFPDNDYASHARGPQDALTVVEAFDQQLGRLATRTFGGIESMLEQVTVVVTGDHAQTDVVGEPATAGLDLSKVLDGYRLVPAGDPWRSGEELMICPNLRAAQIYLRPDFLSRQAELARRLLTDERVDQVIYREGLDQDGETAWHVVVTADRGELRFRPGGTGGVRDGFGNRWSYEGALTAVDGALDATHLRYRDYPNALERIHGSFHEQYSGDLWVTARVGYEFSLPRTTVHAGGGSHGSLHRDDSLSPIIVAGASGPSGCRGPFRSVDVAPLCRSLLDLDESSVPHPRS